MLNKLQNPLSLLGRVLLALVFVPAGWSKITGFQGAVGYAASAGMPMPEAGVAVGLAIELLGGLALLLGFKTRYAALILAVFTFVASFIFHKYWAVPADQFMVTQLLFMKNMGMAGGLLAFAAFGAGCWSLDGKKA